MKVNVGDEVKWDDPERDYFHGVVLETDFKIGKHTGYAVVLNESWRQPKPELVRRSELTPYSEERERRKRELQSQRYAKYITEQEALGVVFHSTSAVSRVHLPNAIPPPE